MVGIQFQTGHWELNIETQALSLCGASQAMFGLSSMKDDPLTGDEWRSRVHPEDLPQLLKDLKASAQSGEPYSHAFRVQLPNGTARRIIGVGAVLRDDTGQSKKMIGLNIEAEPIPVREATFTALTVELPSPAANENEPTAACNEISLALGARRRGNTHGLVVQQILLTRAKAALAIRRSRVQFFDPAMLGEPAFDLMLALYIDERLGEQTVVDQLATIGTSPKSTMRWLGFLQHNGLAQLSGVTGRLTTQGVDSMDQFLASMGPAIEPLIHGG